MPQMQWHVTLCVRQKWFDAPLRGWLCWWLAVLAGWFGEQASHECTVLCFQLLCRSIVDMPCVCVVCVDARAMRQLQITQCAPNTITHDSDEKWITFFLSISEMNWTVNVYEHDGGEGARWRKKNDDGDDDAGLDCGKRWDPGNSFK